MWLIKAKNKWKPFIQTLIATLMGVFMAILLTNRGVEEKEKEDTIKLLRTAKAIITGTTSYTKGLIDYVLEIEKDSTIINKKVNIEKIKTTNPFPFPDLFETIMSNVLISKNISEHSHVSIFTSLINLRKLSSYSSAGPYLNELNIIKLHLDAEIDLLQGKADLEEIKKRLTEIINASFEKDQE